MPKPKTQSISARCDIRSVATLFRFWKSQGFVGLNPSKVVSLTLDQFAETLVLNNLVEKFELSSEAQEYLACELPTLKNECIRQLSAQIHKETILPSPECVSSFQQTKNFVMPEKEARQLMEKVNRKIAERRTSKPQSQTFEEAKKALGGTIVPAAQPQGNEQTSTNKTSADKNLDVSSDDEPETLEQAAKRREKEKQEMLQSFLPKKGDSDDRKD